MAEWKKVIVSGSNISQLNNDTGFITSGDLIEIPAGTVSGSIQVDHDATTNFVANEHIDHTSVSITAGNGLTGGGTIAATRTLNVGAGSGISVTADAVAVDATVLRTTGGGIVSSSAQIDHDQTTNFSADEHFTQANITTVGTVTAGSVTAILPSGTVSGSSQIDLGSASGNIALGTQTTGNYVASLGTLTGLTTSGNTGEGSTPTLSVTYGSSANQAVQGSTTITINVASGELTRDVGTAAQALGGGPSYTLGLADTITGNRTFSGAITISNDLSVTGDLTVSGTVTSLETTNLNVTDQFILLNSGSAAADAGLVINGASSAFGWDQSAGRWAFDHTGATWNQTAITPDAYAAAVVTTDDANYRKNGNIRVQGGEIYIYVE